MSTDKMTEYIEQMAAKLGVAAEHVYGVLLTQMVAEGVVYIIGSLIYLVFFAVLVRWMYSKHVETRNNYESDWGIAFPLFSIFGGVVAIAALMMAFTGLLYVMNPEYYAIREIMNVIGGATR
ncbi:hypothetical protein [Brevibacillus brevis]|uniref:hypothetical protein n=1 Tax=Brevibacillus brevis TaxID=1393 RepID=UPI00165D7A66|nr:hypothetical protein [Brevibacillus brevis]